MKQDEYVRELLRFYPSDEQWKVRKLLLQDRATLTECALGLAGEAGEIVDLLKKHVLYGKELDRQKLLLEMGDLLNYFSKLAYEVGFSLEEIRRANVEKLEARVKGQPDYYVREREDDGKV